MIIDNVEDAEIILKDIGTSIEQVKDFSRRLCIGHGKFLVREMRNLYNSYGGFSSDGFEYNVEAY